MHDKLYKINRNNRIKKSGWICCFTLCWMTSLHAQKDSITTIEFSQIEKSFLTGIDADGLYFHYDFRPIDSVFYYKNSNLNDLIKGVKTSGFELFTNDQKVAITFPCRNEIPETCYQYIGYAAVADVHLISKCKEVCELYALNALNGTAIALPSEFDGGVYPVFLPGYMILYGSYYDYSYDAYYEYRSRIALFEIKETEDITQKFKPIGSIITKNWSIDELHPSIHQNTLLLKIHEQENNYNYLEISF